MILCYEFSLTLVDAFEGAKLSFRPVQESMKLLSAVVCI
jgi:hypothetical protein